MLGRLNREIGAKPYVMVTHDPKAAESARAVVHLKKASSRVTRRIGPTDGQYADF